MCSTFAFLIDTGIGEVSARNVVQDLFDQKAFALPPATRRNPGEGSLAITLGRT
jgi:hypothetical protein